MSALTFVKLNGQWPMGLMAFPAFVGKETHLQITTCRVKRKRFNRQNARMCGVQTQYSIFKSINYAS